MATPRRLGRFDLLTLGATLALVALGALAVASSTLEDPGTAGLWRAQMLWLSIATLAGVVVVAVDYSPFSFSIHSTF